VTRLTSNTIRRLPDQLPIAPATDGGTLTVSVGRRRICGAPERASVIRCMEAAGVAGRDHAKFVVIGIASPYLLPAMKINPVPAGFVVPAQPVKASKPPVGTKIGFTKSSTMAID
jgi:hypothetical protein